MPPERYYFDDLSNLFSSFARLPYLGNLTSLLSAAYDLYDFTIHLFKSNVVLRSVVLRAALSRFFSHALIGLSALFPIITFISFVLFNPCIIPLIAIIPVCSDLLKYYKIRKQLKENFLECHAIFIKNPTEEHRLELQQLRNSIHHYTRESTVSAALVVSAILGASGLLFPPLMLAAIIISLSAGVLGVLDKKYQCSKRLYYFFCDNPETKEITMVKNHKNLLSIHSQLHNKTSHDKIKHEPINYSQNLFHRENQKSSLTSQHYDRPRCS